MLTKQRRSKLEIYYDILNAVQKEAQEGEVKPTRIQHHSNMSYDKMSKYLKEKGQKFLKDYEKIRKFLSNIQLKYLKESNDE